LPSGAPFCVKRPAKSLFAATDAPAALRYDRAIKACPAEIMAITVTSDLPLYRPGRENFRARS
jgi:hypothetical protein